MARDDESDSRSSSSSSSGDENQNASDEGKVVSEYEKKRLARIAENRARMEALGLSKIASSLIGSGSSKRKGKRKVGGEEDDEEYRPDGDDGGDDIDDDVFAGRSDSRSRNKRNVKNRGLTSKEKAPPKKNLSTSDYVEDDDDLMKAIALSLQDSMGGSRAANSNGKGTAEEKGSGKKKKPFTSRLQMTEDELIIYFYQFDEAGKGCITVRDLKKMAVAHDFAWTDEELADMIRCFDGDRDGKLSLDDFRAIVTRCRMLKGSDDS